MTVKYTPGDLRNFINNCYNEIDKKKLELRKLKEELRELEIRCTNHEFNPNKISAVCTICYFDCGWQCKANTLGYCQYEPYDEYCKFCGESRYRK